MKQKFLFSVLACLLAFFYPGGRLISQNVGIGTSNPQAKLHVEGDFKLKNGIAVNTISADSLFTHAADSVLPTQKALQRYMQKGLWAPAAGSLQSNMVFRDSSRTNMIQPWSVFVQGNYAYVSTNNYRLCIYDISNPAAIVAKGSTNANLDNPQSVFVQGNYAYVASQNNHRLCIYDISNPDYIVAKGFTNANLQSPQSVFVQGNYAYVASYGNNRLCIYDISNPDAIVAKDTIGQNIDVPRSVYVQGNYAYVAGASGLSIYDISNPDAIVAKGKTFQNLLANPLAVFVQGNYAYLASGTNGADSRLGIYDVSNPETIVPKGFTNQNLNRAQSVFVQGNYAYVASNNNAQLCVYDISNPDNIVFAGSSGTNLANPTGVFVKDNYAYLTSWTNNALVAFQLYNNGRSLGTGANGELVLEPAAWVSDANGAYRVGGNVGIGTVSPTQKLEVMGTTRTTGFQMTAGAGANRLLQSDATGNASWVSNIELGEDANDAQAVTVRGYSNTPPSWKGGAAFGYTSASVIMGQLGGVATIGGHNGTLSAWSTLLINPVGGNVGIGTSSPSEALDVGGKVKTAALQITGGAAAGYILQSDASGNASWVANLAETDPKVGANTTNFLSKWNGTQLVASTVREDAGNIGIGVPTPANARLQVNGNVILGSTGTRFGSIVSIDINIPQLDPLGGAGAGVKTIPWPVDMDISPNASIIVTPKSQLANGMTIGYAWRSKPREISVYYINHFNNTPVTQAEHTLRITVINFEQ